MMLKLYMNLIFQII